MLTERSAASIITTVLRAQPEVINVLELWDSQHKLEIAHDNNFHSNGSYLWII